MPLTFTSEPGREQFLAVEQDGNRVLIRGKRAKTFVSETNAIRSVAALTALAELGWPIERLIEPEPAGFIPLCNSFRTEAA